VREPLAEPQIHAARLRSDHPDRSTGSPAVMGFPLDRWLCELFFRKECLCQSRKNVGRGGNLSIEALLLAGSSAALADFGNRRRFPKRFM
jgi:hypothetical protein